MHEHTSIVRSEDMTDSDVFAQVVLKNAEAILSILTTGPRTRPKARKVAGTTNPRRAVRRHTEPTIHRATAPDVAVLAGGAD